MLETLGPKLQCHDASVQIRRQAFLGCLPHTFPQESPTSAKFRCGQERPYHSLASYRRMPLPAPSIEAEIPVRTASLESRIPCDVLPAAADSRAISLKSGWLFGVAVAIGVFVAALLPFVAALLPAALLADDTAVVVGVSSFLPLVMEGGGGFEGFDIDIWSEVSDAIGVDTTYRLMQFGDLMEALKSGEIDAAVAGISITRDREFEMVNLRLGSLAQTGGPIATSGTAPRPGPGQVAFLSPPSATRTGRAPSRSPQHPRPICGTS